MIDLITTGSSHQTTAMEALSKGIDEKTSIINVNRLSPTMADTCVCWGVRHMNLLKPYYKKIVVIERGYFNDRMTHYSFGVGGLNGNADFNNANSKPDRWIKHGTGLHTWNRNGEYYLVMGQVSGDMSISGINIDAWYRKITDELLEKTDMPVYFRPHPLSRQYGSGLSIMNGSLSDALSGACGVITYNSNSGVDAILSGAPTMAQDRGSMTWDICAKSVNQLLDYDYPDRSQWAYNLAYTQWTLDELKDGTAWNHLCH
jgi:hypothetical protein